MAVVSIEEPICLLCRHLLEQQPRDDVWVCSVFPEGIPDAIWNNEHDHRLPFVGDGGTQFEPIQPMRQQIKDSRVEQGKQRGGPGSGYHAPHHGRPGQVGGSLPRDEPAVIDYTEDEAFSTAAKMGRVISSTALEDGYCQAEILEYAGDGSGVWKEMVVGHEQHDGNSEVAAYRISELLGLDIVPETVFASHDGREGTSQRFIPDAERGWDFRKRLYELPAGFIRETRKKALRIQYADKIKQLITLDYIIDNHDRHNGNWIIDAGGHFWAVDHGHSRWGMRQPWAVKSIVNSWVTKDLYGFEPVFSIPTDTLQKWEEITRSDWDAALSDVSEDNNVNLDYAWGNFQDMLDAKGLAWEW